MAITSPKRILQSIFCGDPAVPIPILSNVSGIVLGPVRTVSDAVVGGYETGTTPLVFLGTSEKNGGPLYDECCDPPPACQSEWQDEYLK